MVYHSIESYLKAITRWRSMVGKIVNGVGYYLVRDEWIPDVEFFKHNTRPTYAIPEKDNPDGTSIASTVKVKSRK